MVHSVWIAHGKIWTSSISPGDGKIKEQENVYTASRCVDLITLKSGATYAVNNRNKIDEAMQLMTSQ